MSDTKPTAADSQKAAAAAPPPASAPQAPAAPTFPPAPEGMVNVLVDGRHTVVKQGVNLIEAARTVDVEIPYYCYHPRLSIAGQCRMCMVETSAQPGRLVPGCHVRVSEGLHIITTTPAVKDAQRASQEFHLLNHPVDCAICDQAGECKLQDYYVAYDAKAARVQTTKLNKPKRKVFGPLVVYDGERCILCTRCVRFMNEVAEEPQLAMVGRGDHSEIDTIAGQPLDSKYSGNTVDVCPVGALLNRDFRFTSRVWYMDNVRSVCSGCSNGCNVAVEARADQVYRFVPKENEEVNQVWLCDDGRLSYHRTTDDRVEYPRVGRAHEGEPALIDAAVKAAADALAPVVGKKDLAVAVSAQCSTEEIFAAAVFAKDVLKVDRIYATGRAAGEGDDFLIREDKNPNANGLKLAAKAAGLAVEGFDALLSKVQGGTVAHVVSFGVEIPGDATVVGRAFEQLRTFVALAVNESPVADSATVLLPLSTHLEFDGSFVNYYGRLQRFAGAIAPKSESLPAFAWVTKLSAALGAAWTFADGREAFALLATRGEPFAGLTFDGIPEEGVVLPGMLPAEFGRRAPRPTATEAKAAS